MSRIDYWQCPVEPRRMDTTYVVRRGLPRLFRDGQDNEMRARTGEDSRVLSGGLRTCLALPCILPCLRPLTLLSNVVHCSARLSSFRSILRSSTTRNATALAPSRRRGAPSRTPRPRGTVIACARAHTHTHTRAPSIASTAHPQPTRVRPTCHFPSSPACGNGGVHLFSNLPLATASTRVPNFLLF